MLKDCVKNYWHRNGSFNGIENSWFYPELKKEAEKYTKGSVIQYCVRITGLPEKPLKMNPGAKEKAAILLAKELLTSNAYPVEINGYRIPFSTCVWLRLDTSGYAQREFGEKIKLSTIRKALRSILNCITFHASSSTFIRCGELWYSARITEEELRTFTYKFVENIIVSLIGVAMSPSDLVMQCYRNDKSGRIYKLAQECDMNVGMFVELFGARIPELQPYDSEMQVIWLNQSLAMVFFTDKEMVVMSAEDYKNLILNRSMMSLQKTNVFR